MLPVGAYSALERVLPSNEPDVTDEDEKALAPIVVKRIHELRSKIMTQTVNSNKGGVSQAKVSSILKSLVQM
jgi:tryptophan 2,3-dioxygenase